MDNYLSHQAALKEATVTTFPDEPPLISRPFYARLAPATRRWLMMSIVLVIETELVIYGHPREQIFHSPISIYHWFLVFLFFAALRRLLGDRQATALPDHALSGKFLAAHLGYAAGLSLFFTPLWMATSRHPEFTWLWFPVKALYVLSWLATLIPPSRWRETASAEFRWVVPALAGSGLTVFVVQAMGLLWQPFLASATLWCSGVLLSLVLNDVVVAPDKLILGTSHFQIRIAPACSGSESLGLMMGYILVYLFYRRKTMNFPAALWLVPISAAIIWSANVLRITSLVLMGAFLSPDIALGGFHSKAGWIAFSLVSFGLTLVLEKSGWFQTETIDPGSVEDSWVPFLLPFATLLCTRMLSQAFSVGLEVFYPIHILVVSLVLLYNRRFYGHLLKGSSLKAGWIGMMIYLAWINLPVGGQDQAVSPWDQFSAPVAACWLIFRIVGSVVVIPLVEELAFRGFLIRRLQSTEFDEVPLGQFNWPALLLSSLAFGLLHKQVVAATVAGLAYAYAVRRRGRLGDAVIAHATTNLCLVFHVLLLNQWSLWL